MQWCWRWTPILWARDAKNWLIGKEPDAGKGWRQKEKGMAENEMIEWHHQFSGHEFEQALGDGEGQGSLASCSPWGCKELDMTSNWRATQMLRKSYDFSPYSEDVVYYNDSSPNIWQSYSYRINDTLSFSNILGLMVSSPITSWQIDGGNL